MIHEISCIMIHDTQFSRIVSALKHTRHGHGDVHDHCYTYMDYFYLWPKAKQVLYLLVSSQKAQVRVSFSQLVGCWGCPSNNEQIPWCSSHKEQNCIQNHYKHQKAPNWLPSNGCRRSIRSKPCYLQEIKDYRDASISSSLGLPLLWLGRRSKRTMTTTPTQLQRSCKQRYLAS